MGCSRRRVLRAAPGMGGACNSPGSVCGMWAGGDTSVCSPHPEARAWAEGLGHRGLDLCLSQAQAQGKAPGLATQAPSVRSICCFNTSYARQLWGGLGHVGCCACPRCCPKCKRTSVPSLWSSGRSAGHSFPAGAMGQVSSPLQKP